MCEKLVLLCCCWCASGLSNCDTVAPQHTGSQTNFPSLIAAKLDALEQPATPYTILSATQVPKLHRVMLLPNSPRFSRRPRRTSILQNLARTFEFKGGVCEKPLYAQASSLSSLGIPHKPTARDKVSEPHSRPTQSASVHLAVQSSRCSCQVPGNNQRHAC